MKLEFRDRLACPDCGSLAQRIGHYFETHQAGEIVTGIEEETLYVSRDSNGQPWRAGRPGVVVVDGGGSETRHGATVRTSESRLCYALTHWCTNPDCAVVFNASAGRPFRGELPWFAEEGRVPTAAELGFDLETMTPFWRGQYQLMVARLKHRQVTP